MGKQNLRRLIFRIRGFDSKYDCLFRTEKGEASLASVIILPLLVLACCVGCCCLCCNCCRCCSRKDPSESKADYTPRQTIPAAHPQESAVGRPHAVVVSNGSITANTAVRPHAVVAVASSAPPTSSEQANIPFVPATLISANSVPPEPSKSFGVYGAPTMHAPEPESVVSLPPATNPEYQSIVQAA